MDGVQDNGEAEGLDKERVDMTGVVGDVVVDKGAVIVGVAIPNRGEVVFDEGPKDGWVLGGWGSGVRLEGNNSRARGGEDELELGEVVGARFAGVGRGGEGVEVSFSGVGGAEG